METTPCLHGAVWFAPSLGSGTSLELVKNVTVPFQGWKLRPGGLM